MENPTPSSDLGLIISGIAAAQGFSMLFIPAQLLWGVFFMTGGLMGTYVVLKKRYGANNTSMPKLVIRQKLMDVRAPYIDKIPTALLSLRERADALIAKAVQQGLEPRKVFLTYRLNKIQNLEHLKLTHQPITASDFPLDPILMDLKKNDTKYQKYYRELKEAWFYLKHDKLLDVSLAGYLDEKDIQDSETVVSRVVPLPDEEYKLQYDDLMRATYNDKSIELALQAIASSLERLRMGDKIEWKP